MSRLTRLENGIYNPNKELLFVSELMNKLGKLEDLEDELGCPLDVVFKALKEGIWFKSDDFITKNLEKDLATRPRLYYSDDFKRYRFEIGFGLHYVSLKDYSKTWWLKGDKDEN